MEMEDEHLDSTEMKTRRKLFEDVDGSVQTIRDEETLIIVEDDGKCEGGSGVIRANTIPECGMEFDTESAAYELYQNYGRSTGFGTRKGNSHIEKNTNIVLDRSFLCCRAGKRPKDKRDALVKSHRAVTRCDCKAKMKISCRETAKYRVVKFVSEHNHELATPSKAQLFRSYRNISSGQKADIDNGKSVGIAPKQILDKMVKEAGGRENLGFNRDDLKNYLRSKRTVEMKQGDTGCVLEFLQKMQLQDPNFFYAIQVDEDDLITNIFWADAKMRYDFARFGDVVSFDTTYRKHKDGRPIALFVGANHHKQTAVFGAALLYDETEKTFERLFDTFSTAMMGKTPRTMLTDQDGRMMSALASQWPHTYHRLCIWHIFQNAATHLSDVFAKFKDFSHDFSRCIYDFEEEDDFIYEWNQMLERYDLKDNKWLQRMYGMKEKWALVYGRETFCADMTTTQRSETMNSVLKRYVSYKNDLLEIFEHFQRLLNDRRNEENDVDFRCSQSTPAMTFPVEILKHAASVYTFSVFEKFKDELCKGIDCKIENQREDGTRVVYKIQHWKHQHFVTYDSSDNSVRCSCKKFDFAGILCAHVLKVFTTLSIKRIPDEYVLKRWTKGAKRGAVRVGADSCGSVDEKEKMRMRYKELSYMYMQLVTKAAESDDAYIMAKDEFFRMSESMDSMVRSGKKVGNSKGVEACAVEEVSTVEKVLEGKIKGVKVKQKVTYKSSQRPMNALEKATNKRKYNKKEKSSKKTKQGAGCEVENTHDSVQNLMPQQPKSVSNDGFSNTFTFSDPNKVYGQFPKHYNAIRQGSTGTTGNVVSDSVINPLKSTGITDFYRNGQISSSTQVSDSAINPLQSTKMSEFYRNEQTSSFAQGSDYPLQSTVMSEFYPNEQASSAQDYSSYYFSVSGGQTSADKQRMP